MLYKPGKSSCIANPIITANYWFSLSIHLYHILSQQNHFGVDFSIIFFVTCFVSTAKKYIKNNAINDARIEILTLFNLFCLHWSILNTFKTTILFLGFKSKFYNQTKALNCFLAIYLNNV